MFSNKKKLLKSLLTINAGCGRRCSSRYETKDSLRTRPREQPESIHSPLSSTSIDNDTTTGDDELYGSASGTRREVAMENSVAVEKHSDDPYADFKDSMLQMILEKEMYSKEDLQKLLSCFLRLNSPWHHEVIIRAFMEILVNNSWTSCPNDS